MYHQDSAGLQCFDFVTKLDEILGTGINAEATVKALEEKIDPSRKLEGDAQRHRRTRSEAPRCWRARLPGVGVALGSRLL